MNFDVYYDIDCEAFHGNNRSLQFTNVISVTSELIQGTSAFYVVEVMIKGVI